MKLKELNDLQEVFHGHHELSLNTIITYKSALNTLIFILKKLGHQEINSESIEQALIYLKDADYSRSTMIKTVNAIKFLLNKTDIDCNLKPYRFPTEKRLPIYLTISEVDSLLDRIPKQSYLGFLDYAILLLAYTTGLRKNEIRLLNLTDVNVNDRIIFVRYGKGNKERIVPVSQETVFVLKDYVDKFRSKTSLLSDMKSNRYFLNSYGNPLSSQTLQQINYRIKKYYNSTNKHVTLHTFRHAYATHMYENGADLRSIQLMLGHASIDTTVLYVHCHAKHLKEVYNKHHPRS